MADSFSQQPKRTAMGLEAISSAGFKLPVSSVHGFADIAEGVCDCVISLRRNNGELHRLRK